MNKEKAVEIFTLVQQGKQLPQKLEELVPLSFIGQTAVTFYRSKVKLMKELDMTKEQRKTTLQDGQDAGEMLLDIEARIGELAEKEEKTKGKITIRDAQGKVMAKEPSGKPPKHERLGLKQNRMYQAEQIHKHPEVVERVKAQARKNEDIPTRTAVLNEISRDKERKRQEGLKEKQIESKKAIPIEQIEYINELDRCLLILRAAPPKNWNEKAFIEAQTKARILIKRLEVFK